MVPLILLLIFLGTFVSADQHFNNSNGDEIQNHKIVSRKINETHSTHVDYSISIDYSYLNAGESLLRTSSPKLCKLEKLWCDETPPQNKQHNVTYYLATRTQFAAMNNEGFKYYVFATLFDWMLLPTNLNLIKARMNTSNVPFIESKHHIKLFGRTKTPQTIFVFTFAIPFFATYILPNLTIPFVLCSGSNDLTVPYNTNHIYAPFYSVEQEHYTIARDVPMQPNTRLLRRSKTKNHRRHNNTRNRPNINNKSNKISDYRVTRIDQTDVADIYKSSWDTILESPLLLHWFVENRVLSHEKVSTMPIGMNPHENHPDEKSDHPQHVIPLHKRPLKVLQIDRVRRFSGQYRQRTLVHDLCLRNNSDTCVTVSHMVSHKEFIARIATYPFVLCVHGGGIDPSPKAWEALLVGTIPIIEHSPLDDAYSLFPVAFVNNITEFMLERNQTEIMTSWLQELGPHYEEGTKLRERVLEKLTTKYWWNKVTSKLN